MIACVLHGKRDLRIEERPDPVAEADDVLVRVRRVGICGSDVHYFTAGHCGAFVPRRPFVLGHELAGEIAVWRLPASASRSIPRARAARAGTAFAGRSNLCPQMRYLGSASTDPHVDGGLAPFVTVPRASCHALPDAVEDAEAAMLEPLSIAVHAASRAGALEGRSVLIAGAGTVGQLLFRVCRARGASRIELVDVRREPLDFALEHGADGAHLASEVPADLSRFDVVFEASGSPDALRMALELAERGATIVQVGTLPEHLEAPVHLVMQKELQLVGSFRFANVFGDALELIASRRVDVRPLVTHTFRFDDVMKAFAAALDDRSAFKVQVEHAD